MHPEAWAAVVAPRVVARRRTPRPSPLLAALVLVATPLAIACATPPSPSAPIAPDAPPDDASRTNAAGPCDAAPCPSSSASSPVEPRAAAGADPESGASTEVGPEAGSDGDGAAPLEPDPLFDDAFAPGPAHYPDPLESTNRGLFAFNRQVDKWLLDPITEAYQFLVPKPARHAIRRVFQNLASSRTLVNDVLQLEWTDAGITTSRLVINTTAGIGGLFDVAEMIGLDRHESDFGQTLALAGVPSGPYLVLPVLGPANVRDGIGRVVDGFFEPTFYILGPSDLIMGPTEVILYSGSSGITTRESRYAELKALEDSSVDFYAALRSGFFQDRVGTIWGRRDCHRTTHEPGMASPAALDDHFDPLFDE